MRQTCVIAGLTGRRDVVIELLERKCANSGSARGCARDHDRGAGARPGAWLPGRSAAVDLPSGSVTARPAAAGASRPVAPAVRCRLAQLTVPAAAPELPLRRVTPAPAPVPLIHADARPARRRAPRAAWSVVVGAPLIGPDRRARGQRRRWWQGRRGAFGDVWAGDAGQRAVSHASSIADGRGADRRIREAIARTPCCLPRLPARQRRVLRLRAGVGPSPARLAPDRRAPARASDPALVRRAERRGVRALHAGRSQPGCAAAGGVDGSRARLDAGREPATVRGGAIEAARHRAGGGGEDGDQRGAVRRRREPAPGAGVPRRTASAA